MSTPTFNSQNYTNNIIPAPLKSLFADISFAELVAAAITLATGIPTTIDDIVTQATLDQVKALRALSGASRKITNIEGIGHLRDLEELIFEHQYITRLPEDFGTLANLKTAHLVNSKLTSIPDWIGSLTSLTRLNLSSQLPIGTLRGAVPESVGNLDKLERLDVANNNNLCGKLPDSLTKLTLLKELLVQSNAFEDLTVLNTLPVTTALNVINQALGTCDFGGIAKDSALPVRLPNVLVQVQTLGDKMYDPTGILITGNPGAYLDSNHLYVHLPTTVPGPYEITLSAHGRLTYITYKYTIA